MADIGPSAAGPPPPAADAGAPLFDPPPLALWAEAAAAGLTLGQALELAVAERNVARVWSAKRRAWFWIRGAQAVPNGAVLELLDPTDPTGTRTIRPPKLTERELAAMRGHFRP